MPPLGAQESYTTAPAGWAGVENPPQKSLVLSNDLFISCMGGADVLD